MCLVESWTNIDWATTGTMMQGVGTLGGAVAVYAAARMGLSAWKHQKLAERNRDQAEVILHAAYNARRALGYLRSPWMSGGELAAAEEKLNSSEPKWRNSIFEEKQKRLITAQAYYMRANQLLDDRTKLEDCLPMARALFGEDLENAIETLHHQFHIVRHTPTPTLTITTAPTAISRSRFAGHCLPPTSAPRARKTRCRMRLTRQLRP
jgi:hypothetical protein